MTKSTINLVQFTDQHLFGDPTRALRGVVTLPALRATLSAARSDIGNSEAILATGDLVNDDAGGYELFRTEFAALGKPVLCIPGNHDDVPAMRAALSEPPFQLGGVYDAGNWRTILLDSTIPGETGGALSADSMRFLEAALAGAPDRHALVCLHHHPIPMHSRWLDTVGLANGNEMVALLKRFANVRAVLFGHVHQQLDRDWEGVRMIATPSTCSQFKPLSDDFAVDNQPPAWRTLALHADGRLDTALRWLGDWQDPRA
ncbi:MAG: 3',5'-cyclic-AMP phosphodiesterase [Steroidobacteraceae bacterium]